jgi:hypothetical protein
MADATSATVLLTTGTRFTRFNIDEGVAIFLWNSSSRKCVLNNVDRVEISPEVARNVHDIKNLDWIKPDHYIEVMGPVALWIPKTQEVAKILPMTQELFDNLCIHLCILPDGDPLVHCANEAIRNVYAYRDSNNQTNK